MTPSDLIPDKVKLGANLWFVKVEAEWNKRSPREKIVEVRQQKEVAVTELREALSARDRSAIRKWKARLKAIEEELDYLEEVEIRHE